MKKNMILVIIGGIVALLLVVALVLLFVKSFTKEPIEMPGMETESTAVGNEEQKTNVNYVTYDGYTELIALVSTQEEADEIAKLYGIELKRFNEGVAVYVTKENPRDVILRGEENGWPPVALNNVIKLSPIETPAGDKNSNTSLHINK